MPTAPAAQSPPPGRPLHARDEFSLAALLDLFEDHQEPARPVPGEPAPRRRVVAGIARRVARAGVRLRAWATACRRRAAEWGMGPGGSRRAW